MSYAFPEVRSHVVRTFEKAVALGPDGVCALFHRGPPFVLFEKPLVTNFMQEYGRDPRSLPETDDLWLRSRAKALTEFMRELRKRVSAMAGGLGVAIPKISCVVFPTRERNLLYGIDLEAWVEEGLIDRVLARDVLYASWENEPVDLSFFQKLTRGRCGFYVMLGSASAVYRTTTTTTGGDLGAAYAAKASALFDAGVEGLAFWDTNLQDRFTANWTALRQLGHVKEPRAKRSPSIPAVRSLTLQRLGGVDVTFRHDAWYYV
jgi:hypothetical protein